MDHDLTIDEKRIYGDRTGAVSVSVAAEQGVVVASLSGDRVGEFGLDVRATARDVAVSGVRRAVATDEDVLVGAADPTTFGPAAAVGFDGDDLLAAAPDGRVARLDDGWATLGRVDTPRAIDCGLIAAADGVHRVASAGLRPAGLDDVRDVAARGAPLAATGDGLYRLGNGWMDERDGAFDVVSTDPATARTHAVGADGPVARVAVGEWTPVDAPGGDRIVDVDYTADAVVAATEAGTLIADAGDGWRTHELGVTDVSGLAVHA